MSTPKDCEHVSGRKYFFYQKQNGEWTGSTEPQAIHTRTFMPKDTDIKQADDLATLISILKTDKVPLKEENLSAETIKVMDEMKVPYTKKEANGISI